MSYWDAVFGVAVVIGILVAGFLAIASVIVALAFAFGMNGYPWWVRLLCGLYATLAIIFGIATIVWDVTNS